MEKWYSANLGQSNDLLDRFAVISKIKGAEWFIETDASVSVKSSNWVVLAGLEA